MGYATDLTTNQRNFIFENFPEIFKTKSKADLFEILNALFFLIKTGCQWKLLPNDFPKWRTVYEFYRKWTSTGFFDRLTCRLNFGTSEFKPIDGRWVVERTFSWLESFRRLNRNYEQFLNTAKGVAMAACAMFMLRFV